MSLFVAILSIVIAIGVIFLNIKAEGVEGILPAFPQIIPIVFAILGVVIGDPDIMYCSLATHVVAGFMTVGLGVATLY